MAQITFYVDDETRSRIETAAARAGASVSAWIKRKLEGALDDEWPDGYFDLFGSLRDGDLERPPQPHLDEHP